MEVKSVVVRLAGLIDMGEEVLETCHEIPNYRGVYANEGLYRQWRTSSLAFLKTFPSEYIYSDEFEKCCKSTNSDDIIQGMAVLRAAKEDIEGGYLQKFETLVSASVFSDFLEMAEHLLTNGYKDPSASLIGAVLEDSLRRICVNDNITVKSDDNISSLNQKLAQKPVYNPLQQKQIQVWNKLRDYADHGHFDEYKANDVKDMLKGVRNFLTSYLK